MCIDGHAEAFVTFLPLLPISAPSASLARSHIFVMKANAVPVYALRHLEGRPGQRRTVRNDPTCLSKSLDKQKRLYKAPSRRKDLAPIPLCPQIPNNPPTPTRHLGPFTMSSKMTNDNPVASAQQLQELKLENLRLRTVVKGLCCVMVLWFVFTHLGLGRPVTAWNGWRSTSSTLERRCRPT